MPFVKYTAPKPEPKPKPHLKFVRTVIQFTEDGLAHMGEIAGNLRHASHVNLWHDANTSKIAITPTTADDPDAFTIANGKIQAKKFFEAMHIAWPIKSHDKQVEAHDGGVKLTVGTTAAKSASSVHVNPIPKTTKQAWKPGEPLGKGARSKEQKAWLATDDGKKWLAAQGK